MCDQRLNRSLARGDCTASFIPVSVAARLVIPGRQVRNSLPVQHAMRRCERLRSTMLGDQEGDYPLFLQVSVAANR